MQTEKILKSSSKPTPLREEKKGINLKNHNKLDEELKPLSLINKAINDLNGVKGLYI